VVVDQGITLRHERPRLGQRGYDVLVMLKVIVLQRPALPVFEPLLADLVSFMPSTLELFPAIDLCAGVALLFIQG
jgi:hypothetical protein